MPLAPERILEAEALNPIIAKSPFRALEGEEEEEDEEGEELHLAVESSACRRDHRSLNRRSNSLWKMPSERKESEREREGAMLSSHCENQNHPSRQQPGLSSARFDTGGGREEARGIPENEKVSRSGRAFVFLTQYLLRSFARTNKRNPEWREGGREEEEGGHGC